MQKAGRIRVQVGSQESRTERRKKTFFLPAKGHPTFIVLPTGMFIVHIE